MPDNYWSGPRWERFKLYCEASGVYRKELLEPVPMTSEIYFYEEVEAIKNILGDHVLPREILIKLAKHFYIREAVSQRDTVKTILDVLVLPEAYEARKKEWALEGNLP